MSTSSGIIREAIILAGGLGTRLRDAVPDLPKCMAPVAGKPFIDHVIAYYRQQGIQRFVFSLGYLHHLIEAHIRNVHTGIEMEFAIEAEPLGTGGAIRNACTYAKEDQVLVLNGDTLFRIELEELSRFHASENADCTLCLKPMTHFNRYGVVELNAEDRVIAFKEKQHYEKGLINGGVYALQRRPFLAEALPERFSFEKDYLEVFYRQRKLCGIVQSGYFIDIGIPEDFNRAQTELAEHE